MGCGGVEMAPFYDIGREAVSPGTVATRRATAQPKKVTDPKCGKTWRPFVRLPV